MKLHVIMSSLTYYWAAEHIFRSLNFIASSLAILIMVLFLHYCLDKLVGNMPDRALILADVFAVRLPYPVHLPYAFLDRVLSFELDSAFARMLFLRCYLYWLVSRFLLYVAARRDLKLAQSSKLVIQIRLLVQLYWDLLFIGLPYFIMFDYDGLIGGAVLIKQAWFCVKAFEEPLFHTFCWKHDCTAMSARLLLRLVRGFCHRR